MTARRSSCGRSTPSSDGVFAADAEGLAALRDAGGVVTPEVVLADRDLLVLSALHPRPGTRALVHLHATTRHPRYG